jgi:hypothetical protein
MTQQHGDAERFCSRNLHLPLQIRSGSKAGLANPERDMKPWLGLISESVMLALLVQPLFTVRWLYRHTRNEEILRWFVRDLATYHLPHIYHWPAGVFPTAGN